MKSALVKILMLIGVSGALSLGHYQVLYGVSSPPEPPTRPDLSESNPTVTHAPETVPAELFGGSDKRVISATKAYKLYRNPDVMFMDGRPKAQYDYVHIDGAYSVPFREVHVLDWIKDLDPEQEIVVYCFSVTCPISDVVAEELAEMGFKNVWVFSGGLEAWARHNYPMSGPGADLLKAHVKQK